MPLSFSVPANALRRTGQCHFRLRRRLRCPATFNPSILTESLTYADGSSPSAAATPQRTFATRPHSAAAADDASGRLVSASASPAVAPPRAALPSPVEVHQVIARSVQRGRWAHAVRLLLGALHSRCVPLAETYQLVLLAALRGGGWQASVELTEQVATSPLSTTALYHTAADLLLSQVGQEAHGFSEQLTHAVTEQLVPLMLADATAQVVWKPRHRESVLRVLTEAKCSLRVSELFQRWSCASSIMPAGGAVYACGEVEAALLMRAFAETGDWRSAETLRSLLSTLSDDLLVMYVQAYTTALKTSKAAAAQSTVLNPRQQLVPFEAALDVAARHHGNSALTAAVAQLHRVARQSAAPSDASRWWWSTDTTVHAKLTELRRRAATAPAAVMTLLADCHVTRAEVAELLRAVAESGVLASGEDTPPYFVDWLQVSLCLSCHCPSALVGADGAADGLLRLLPHPLMSMPALPSSPFSSSLSSVSPGEKTDGVPVWQYAARFLLVDAALGDGDGGSVARLQRLSALLHYLLFADRVAAAAAPKHTTSAATRDAIAEAVLQICSETSRNSDKERNEPLRFTSDLRDALTVHWRTVSAYATVPSWELCTRAVCADATTTAVADVVDPAVLAWMRPLDQWCPAALLCEVLCGAAETAPLISPQEAYVLLLCVCDPLRRDGAAVVATLRPVLRRVESVLRRAHGSNAESLVVLSAQLQWCWGGSLEALRALAVPVLRRRQCWPALTRLIAKCPPPLSAQEQRAAVACAQGGLADDLRAAVAAADVDRAWALWRTLHGDKANTEVALPASLQSDLAMLLFQRGRLDHMREALTASATVGNDCLEGAAGAPPVSWPQLGLQVMRHVLRHPAADVTLPGLWAVVHVEGSAVVQRETTAGLAMCAAFALHQLHRDTDAVRLLQEAEAYAVHYDTTHHHQHQRSVRSVDVRNEDVNEASNGSTVAFDCDGHTLMKTDEQLVARIPLYVQCAMPSILLTALQRRRGAAAGDASEARNDREAVLRVTRYIFSLTLSYSTVTQAWAEMFTQTAAMVATVQDSNANDKSAGAAAQLRCLVDRLLTRAVEQRVPLPLELLEIVVKDSDTGTCDRLREALRVLQLGSSSSSNNNPNDKGASVQSVAAQMAHTLAARGHHTHALEWVDEFDVWRVNATAAGRLIAADTLWRWIQASVATAQHHADTRTALHRQQLVAAATAPAGRLPPTHDCLDDLIACEAWQDVFDCYLGVVGGVLEGQDVTGELRNFSEAAMACAERRDRYLTTDTLVRVMRCVGQHAPWRASVQAWMLLSAHVPFLRWGVAAEELGAAWQALLAAMVRQGARPQEVGTVVRWIVAQFSVDRPAAAPLLRIFADVIASTPSLSAAAVGRACGEQLRHVRRLLSEQRVHDAAWAIAQAESLVALPPSLQPPASREVAASAEAWLLPGRPPLSEAELDELAVLAPLLQLATTPQLESLSRHRLGGRFDSFELPSLLFLYRSELRQRVAAAGGSGEVDSALLQFLSHNVTLHVLASQAFRCGVDEEAAAWLAESVFDGLLSRPFASALWLACRGPAAQFAQCRWSPIVEAELSAALLHNFGKPPTHLRTAPHVSRQAIAHYWSCYHRVLQPELHFGPLELCCLAAYAPAVSELRRIHGDSTQPGYRSAMTVLADYVHQAHFSASRVPVEDTLAHLRAPHAPAAIAAVLTRTHKKLQTLHAQLFSSDDVAANKEGGVRTLPPHLRWKFAATADAFSKLRDGDAASEVQPATVAAAVRRLCGDTIAAPTTSVSLSPAPPTTATTTANVTAAATAVVGAADAALPRAQATSRLASKEAISVGQMQTPSTLLPRAWVQWVTTECAVPRRPIPPAASLMLVEWVRSAVSTTAHHSDHHPAEATVNTVAADAVNSAQAQWRAVAALEEDAVRHRRCQELGHVWEVLTRAEAWSLMNSGHRAALEKMVYPSPAQLKALPSKSRGGGGQAKQRK